MDKAKQNWLWQQHGGFRYLPSVLHLLATNMVAVLLLVGNITQTHAASFDCAKANTAVEKMICADAELSKLDEEMQPLYQQAKEQTADPFEFKAEQRQWLKTRDFCKEISCVTQAYQTRFAVLHSLLQAPKPCFRLLERKWVTSGLKAWPEVASGHYPVCVDVLKSMNALCGDLPLCEWKVSPSVPLLSLPQWEELDPPKYLKLIQHMYQKLGTFLAPEEQWTSIPSDVLRNIQEGKTRLWHASIDIDRDGEKENVIRFHVQSCIDKEYGNEFYRTGSATYVADASMNRLDPRHNGSKGMDIIFHDNRAFVLSRDFMGSGRESFSVQEPFWTEQASGKTSVCVFEYLKN